MRGPAILSEAPLHADWVARPLIEAGCTLQSCAFQEVPDRLRSGRFEVLVLGQWYTLRHTQQQEQRALADVIAAIDAFLKAGGGVFFALPIGGVLSFDGLLSAYGARILELAVDQADDLEVHDHDTLRIRYAYTRNVAPEVSASVGGVWFPAYMGSAMGTRPVWGDPAAGWRPLLSAAEASRTDAAHVGTGNHEAVVDANQPSYDRAVPLVITRQVGRGRLAVCGIPSGYHIASPHNYPVARRLLMDGFGDRPSGMQHFLINTLRYLAAPAAGVFGGAETDPQVLRPQVPRYPDDPPVAWANPTFPPDDPAPRRGLIGARTAYSSGHGSVADYVARAKAHGLDFLVFLETFDELDAAKLEALKADCAVHSTDDFFAVPGFTMTDVAGTHYFQYGFDIAMPSKDLLDASGKHIAPAEKPVSRNSRLENAHAHFVFVDLKLKCHHGRYRYGESSLMFEENRFSDTVGLITWHRGQIIDDVRDSFGHLVAQGMRPIPAVITLLDEPDDLDRAVNEGWRNVLFEPYATVPDQVLRKYMAPELEWWGMIDEEASRHPRFRFDRWQYGTPYQYASNGPDICAWVVSVTSRDPSWRAPDTEIPPVADAFRNDVIHFRLRLKARSADGLAEVILHDGRRTLRRWRPDGAATFETELDLAHAQQLHLWLEAVDRKGARAMVADFTSLRLDWCEFYCADRNNPLMLGVERDADGNAYGWSGTIYLYYNNGPWGGTAHVPGRLWYGGDNIYPAPRSPIHDETAPTDGGVGIAGGGLHVFPTLPQEHTLMVQSDQELISPDVAIDAFTLDRVYDPAWPWFFGRELAGFGLYPSQPSRHLLVHRRAWVFRPQPYRLTTLVYEFDISWKEPPPDGTPLRLGWLDGEVDHVLHRQDGSAVALRGRDTAPLTIPWRHGEAVVSWEEGTRPAVFYNDGPDLELWRDTESDPEGLHFTNPQGERLVLRMPAASVPCRLRFLACGGTSDMRDPDVAGTLCRAMGLEGTPAYALDVEQGRVRSRRLVLELEAAEHAVVFRVPAVELPAALPVAVHGLNPGWTVLLFDRGQRRLRPLGQLAGSAYAVLASGEAWDVAIGHPVTASDARAVLDLVQTGDAAWQLEAHNPTDEPLTGLRLQPAAALPFRDWRGETIDLPAGTSRVFTLAVGG